MTNKLISKRELEISLTMRPVWELKDLFNLIDRMPLVDGGFIRHGHWTDRLDCYVCSECEVPADKEYSYCPCCGAKMDEVEDEWEEPEINPCRGCIDYDGQGGCRSNGGCGADMKEERRWLM